MIKLKRAEEICSQFEQKRILVFGDVILDRYIFGSVERISPEAPVPVVKVDREELRVGGAGNVAVNIDKLGACGILVGLAGNDMYANELKQLKPQNNFLILSPANRTVVKTRVISQRQQIVRIDWEDQLHYTPEIETTLHQVLEPLYNPPLHGIIISDYAKGTLTHLSMKMLETRAQELAIPIIVDPKPPNFPIYHGIEGITPNLKEAEALVNKKINTDTEAANATKIIRNKFNSRFSVITRGSKGITAGERNKKSFHLPAFNHEVYDVTGAGDTVVSVLMLSLVSGATLREAAALANTAASIVVEKIGASQVTIEEIIQRTHYLHHHSPITRETPPFY